MAKTCVKCGYERQLSDTGPDYECPKCEVIYANATAARRHSLSLKIQRGLSLLTILAVISVLALLTYAKVSYDKKQKAKVVAEQMLAVKLEKEKAEKLEQIERERAEQAEKLKRSQSIASPVDIMSRIQANVRNSLKDPDSAKFGQFFEVDSENACIGVNAKNAFGGYTGEKFISLMKSQNGDWVVTSSSTEFSDASCRLSLLTKR